MRLKRYLLNEKTFSISADVKYVYDKCFKGIIDDIWTHAGSGKWLQFTSPAIERIRNGKYKKFWGDAIRQGRLYDATYKQIMSEDLPSKDAKEASKLNPAVITCGIYRGGNFYRPMEEYKALWPQADRSMISLSLNGSAFHLALTAGQDMLPGEQIRSFNNEFNPDRIKATMAHEISHWMNDTFHNFHITKTLKVVRELGKPEILLLHKKDVNMTHFEIDAQIHGIKQLKMKYRKKWDELTLADVFFEYNSLRFMGGQIYAKYGKKVGDIWQKAVVKRMAREKLLGKNMRTFAKYPEDFK